MFPGCGVPTIPGWFSTTFPKIAVAVMTSGLSQVCKPLFGVSKGMLPVKNLAKKILMAVNYCGCQLARRLGWATPVHLEKEGATPHPGTSKHSLQCDGRPGGRIWGAGWDVEFG